MAWGQITEAVYDTEKRRGCIPVQQEAVDGFAGS